MANVSRYPDLEQLIGCYFHEDCEGSFNEVIRIYISESTPHARALVMRDIDNFKLDNVGRVEEIYRREFNDNIDLSYWDFTYESFLDEIKKRLTAAQ